MHSRSPRRIGTRENGDTGFQVDLRWEAMMPVFDGKLPLFVHAETLAQMEAALAWAKEAQLKIVLVGGSDAWRLAPQLKESDTPVIIARATAMPSRRDDPYDSAFANAARLHEAGVRFCMATKGRESEAPHERSLPYEAAMASAFGLPKDEALKSLTLYAAQLLGVGDRLGSLEPGKAATLIVTNGDPLDLPTQVEAAYIDGRKIDLSNRQTRCAINIRSATGAGDTPRAAARSAVILRLAKRAEGPLTRGVGHA
jgi:imidazolonepropionase-like amidohydrolase